MINFNDVYYKSVQKEAVAWTQSLSTMLFDLPREGLKDLKIPLSSPIFKRVWPKTIRSKAFHLTDFDGCLLYTSPSPRDRQKSRMPSSA